MIQRNKIAPPGFEPGSSDPESVAGSGPAVGLALIRGWLGANTARSSHENSHDSAPYALSGRPDLLAELDAWALVGRMYR